ncbi:uncharacterized protein LOC125053725 [Pieris napi]|uniref:uncharacterized protein LOC125053725 n=1 Tax=Pieris napi TaxID=78633 RepID=UPI001FBA30CD|nr:uncharacterized protein LOC125053725 [Pieris napi]
MLKMNSIKDQDNADTISIDTLALEEILEDERAQEISELNSLSDKVCYLHTNLLYYRNPKSKMGSTCYEAWRTLVKKVGGSPNTWKDLGYALGVNQGDLDYISHSVKDDPADIILKVYMQSESATLDKVLDALIKMKRYDILKAVEDPLCNLAQCFVKDDSGYQSNSDTGKREIISLTKNVPNDLPPALSKKYVKNADKPKQPSLKPSTKADVNKRSTVEATLFLTYTEDGLDTAINIQHYVNNWDEFSGITVLTLNGKREEVVQNPEKFIREYFEKAHFIVPIITTGYLSRIKSYTPLEPTTDDNLDFKYVNFIYNLIVNYYIHASGCINEKVRSVLPQNVNVDVLRDISMYPDLMPWTYETNFDEHFKAFLKNLFVR